MSYTASSKLLQSSALIQSAKVGAPQTIGPIKQKKLLMNQSSSNFKTATASSKNKRLQTSVTRPNLFSAHNSTLKVNAVEASAISVAYQKTSVMR